MAMKGGGGPQKSRVHSTPRSPERPQYQVSTLTKALDTLEALAKTNVDVGLTELAKRIGLSPPTLFRILSTLQARGYVQKNIHLSQYRLGLKTWEIGIAAIRRLTIREVAHPWLEQLMRETNETTHLAV